MTTKPMLAANVSDSEITYPTYASVKLDGVRGLVIDGVLKSRSLKPIPNRHVTKLLSNPLLRGFDGELIVGKATAKDVFIVTSGALRRESGKPFVTFCVFDLHDSPRPFAERQAVLSRRIRELPDELKKHVVLLSQSLIHDRATLLKVETVALEAGYEGLILRSPNGMYKFGRSTVGERGMLKLKRFEDSEAVILDVVEELANNNPSVRNALGRGQRSGHIANLSPKGTAGAITVKDVKTGITFSIGTGFTAKQRAQLWANRDAVVGLIVKYKSFKIGVKDAPRFPVFLGYRDSWDSGE